MLVNTYDRKSYLLPKHNIKKNYRAKKLDFIETRIYLCYLFATLGRNKTRGVGMLIQGVHKVRVHFKKIITLIVFAIEIICKKDLKEENRYFLRFY